MVSLRLDQWQLKRLSTSMPRTTASFPSAIAWRASAGVRTMRNHPFPGPPLFVSRNVSNATASASCSSMAAIESEQTVPATCLFPRQSASFVTASIEMSRRPP